MLIGGYGNKKSSDLFSKKTNLWTVIEPKSATIRLGHGSLTIKNECYVFGGVNNKRIDKYSYETNEFITLNFLNSERFAFGYSLFRKDSFILAGGYNSHYMPTDACFVYNMTSNILKRVGSLNIKRAALVLVNCMGSIYAIGGLDNFRSLRFIEKFNKVENK